jgi:hypothetical protein
MAGLAQSGARTQSRIGKTPQLVQRVLDVSAGLAQNRREMFRRAFGMWLWLLYVASIGLLGLTHHHHERATTGHDAHCEACVWQLNAVTDTPVTCTLIAGETVESLVIEPSIISISTPFCALSASRAPPLASA